MMMRKELEKMLNLLGKNGRKLYGRYCIGTVQCYSDEVTFQVGEEGPIEMGYHELFSVDSGLMEFVHWKNKSDRKTPEIDMYVIRYLYNPNYAYEKMGPMTAEQKIIHFLENAYV